MRGFQQNMVEECILVYNQPVVSFSAELSGLIQKGTRFRSVLKGNIWCLGSEMIHYVYQLVTQCVCYLEQRRKDREK